MLYLPYTVNSLMQIKNEACESHKITTFRSVITLAIRRSDTAFVILHDIILCSNSQRIYNIYFKMSFKMFTKIL